MSHAHLRKRHALLLGTALAGLLEPRAGLADQASGCSPSAVGSGGTIVCGPAGNTYGGFDTSQSAGIHFDPTADAHLTIQAGTTVNGVHTVGFGGDAAGVSFGYKTFGSPSNAGLTIDNYGTIDLSYYSSTYILGPEGIAAYSIGSHDVTISNFGTIRAWQALVGDLDGDGTVTINNTEALDGQPLFGTQPGTQINAQAAHGNTFDSVVITNSGAISAADTGIEAYAFPNAGVGSVTITNSAAIAANTGIDAEAGAPSASITIHNAGALTAASYKGIYAALYGGTGSAAVFITNTGSVTSYDRSIDVSSSGGTSSVSIHNSAPLISDTEELLAIDTTATAGAATGTVINTGNLTATAADALSVVVHGTTSATATITNSGAVNTTGSGYFGIVGNVDASTGPATIAIANSGDIVNDGPSIQAFYSGGTAGSIGISNSGTLSGGTGILATLINGTGSVGIVNAGSVTSSTNAATVSTGGGGTSVTIANSGILRGAVSGIVTDDTPTSITNTGQIISDAAGGTAISMGAGANRLTIGGGSSITGFVVNGSSNSGTFSVADTNVLAFGGTGTGTFDLSQVAQSPSQLGYALTGNTRQTTTPVVDTTHQYQGFSSFEKTGTSTITVTGSTSNNGNWAVSGGRLNVAGTISNVAVANGGTLGGPGTVGNVTVAAGGTLAGQQGQTLTINSLTLAAGSHTSVTLDGSSTAALFNVTGNATLNGSLDLVSATGTFANGVTRLIDYAGTLSGSGLTLGTIEGSVNVPDASLQTSVGGQVNLVTAPTTASFWNGGNPGSGTIQGGSGTWNANTLWTNAAADLSTTIRPAAFAVFEGTAGTVRVDTSAGPVGIGGMQFVTDGYLVTGGSITLTEAQTPIRVGDGTAAGAGITATIASVLTGSAQLVKTDFGTLALTGANTYTGGTHVETGTLAISNPAALGTGTLVLDEGTTLAFRSGLTLTNAVSFPDLGDPIIDTGNHDVTIAGGISGIGDLSKIGTGTLTLAGTNSYTGATDVVAGTLLVDGSAASSPVTVESGATLGGSGTIGGLAAVSGSSVAPGLATPYSTLKVAGNLTFDPGSVYQVRITAAGRTDAIVATGTATINGGTVDVLAGNGIYSPTTTYRILTAAGGRTGEFGSLATTTNLAFLTPSLSYSATGVDLGFARTTPPGAPGPSVVSFASAADTPNGRAVAGAIDSIGPGDALYAAVLSQSVAGARQAFNALSGEVYASIATAGFGDTRMVREAILTRIFDADRLDAAGGAAQALAGVASPALPAAAQGYAPAPKGSPAPLTLPRFALWGQGFGDFGQNRGNGNAATLDRALSGFVMGGDTRIDDPLFNAWRVGLVGGYTNDEFEVKDRSSSGSYQSAFGGLYGSASYGAIGIRLGATAGRTWTDTSRTALFPGFLQTSITGHTSGDVVQGFGELGYKFGLARGVLEPVVGGAAIHLDQGGFRESDGPASLIGSSRGYDIQTVTPGVRAEATPFASLPVTLRAFLGYRHAFGDVNPTALLAFETGSSSFKVTGAPIDRDAVVTEVGLDYRTASPWTLGVAYSGQYGARAESSAVRGRVEYRF